MRELKFRAWDSAGQKMTEMKTLFLDIRYKTTTTIMQFTGLKDKNGIDIYEGDVLSTADGNLQVVWNMSMATFGLIKKGWAFTHFFGESCDNEKSEVIGNIYQSPELIK